MLSQIGSRIVAAGRSTVTPAFASRASMASAPELPAFDYTPPAYTGPSKEDVLAQRKKHLNQGLFIYYKKPVMMVDGKMQYLFDEQGKRYLDMFAGIVTVSVGHCHPKVNEAIHKQVDAIQHTTTIYLHPNIGEYAEKLLATLPDKFTRVYFTNSGSEANEMAMMMARLHSGNFDMLALRNAYHGMSTATMGLTAHSNWKYNVPQGMGVHHLINPDKYRGPFGDDLEMYKWDIKSVTDHTTSGALAGFIAEPIQGVGGTVEHVDGYLAAAYEHTRAHGGVNIADEVQTGFGRTGTHFWGFEKAGVSPDIVTMAKGIGNGLPLAAVATTEEIGAHMADRLHFNTYGGNPISMAAGSAVLDVIAEEGIQANALARGAEMIDGMNKLMNKYDVIGDVRGKGLMLGMEFVSDRQAKTPAPAEAADFFERCKDHGLIVGKGGRYGNCIRIKPPMCITAEDVEFSLAVMDKVLAEM